MISYEDFKKKYRVSDERLSYADIGWNDLCKIYEGYEEKLSEFGEILDEFLSDYFSPILIRKYGLPIHSIGSRIKDPEHLIEKIIRRKIDNSYKYSKCDVTNYLKFITDVVGIRILLVYKTDWLDIHNYIINIFENDETKYIKDSIDDFDDDENHTYIAEPPKVHVRKGDRTDIYDNVLSPDRVYNDRIYRSVHYIIKYKGIYIEIQVRTLFEEGWGEVDHSIRYPTNIKNHVFKDYSELLNRLSGLADEMSAFFVELKNLGTNEAYEENIDKETLNSDLNISASMEENVKNDKDVMTYQNAISRIILDT